MPGQKNIYQKWHDHWEVGRDNTPLGRIKQSTEPWPHSRSKERPLDVVLTRLRLDTTKLNYHMARMKQIESPLCTNCSMGENETPAHFLLYCPAYETLRRSMRRTLRCHGVMDLTLPTLLGAWTGTESVKCHITEALCKFLKKTGRVFTL